MRQVKVSFMFGGDNIKVSFVIYNKKRFLSKSTKMFTVCQGTCFCAGKGEGFQKQKVLYCFGEAVIERQNIRDDESEEGEEETEIFYLQLAQCVVILTSLLAVLIVLLLIRRGLSRLNTQLRKIIRLLPEAKDWDHDSLDT